MTEPSRGQQRCMIYAPTRRRLDDGCHTCLMSDVYCQAVRDMERQPCCNNCSH
jgi:hypothetical protein